MLRRSVRVPCRPMMGKVPLLARHLSSVHDALVDGVKAGKRLSIARTVSLLESTRQEDREAVEQVFAELLRSTSADQSLRIGISGPPGVGKSTIIEALGMHVVEKQQQKLAVLAVDPSSTRTGGSILGDKTRMSELAQHPRSFIRPSPSRGVLGGVARGTHASIRVMEAAGYDKILVETVGVGQSEIEVEDMVDVFLLLLPPGGGDELQGIKKGVVEVADFVAITKADGDLLPAALRAKTEYRNALTLFRKKRKDWVPKVVTTSSRTGEGIAELWEAIEAFETQMRASGEFMRRREEQALTWMWRVVDEVLIDRVKNDPCVTRAMPGLVEQVKAGRMLPGAAGDEILKQFFGSHFKS